jgi:hypothetical protein
MGTLRAVICFLPMERRIKYEPAARELPWSIYRRENGRDIYERGFQNWVDADKWVLATTGKFLSPNK